MKGLIVASLLAVTIPAHAATFGRVNGPQYHIDCRQGCHIPCDITSQACIRNLLTAHTITRMPCAKAGCVRP